MSRCLGSKISGSLQTFDMYDFPVHDGTQEQNGSRYLRRSTIKMAVSVNNDFWDPENLQLW